MESGIKNNKYWKKLLKKYIDFDDNGKVDWWEVLIIVLIIFLFQLGTGILSNLITKGI